MYPCASQSILIDGSFIACFPIRLTRKVISGFLYKWSLKCNFRVATSTNPTWIIEFSAFSSEDILLWEIWKPTHFIFCLLILFENLDYYNPASQKLVYCVVTFVTKINSAKNQTQKKFLTWYVQPKKNRNSIFTKGLHFTFCIKSLKTQQPRSSNNI